MMGRSNLDDAVPTYLIASKRQKNGSVEEAKSCKVVCTELIHSAKREKGVCVWRKVGRCGKGESGYTVIQEVGCRGMAGSTKKAHSW